MTPPGVPEPVEFVQIGDDDPSYTVGNTTADVSTAPYNQSTFIGDVSSKEPMELSDLERVFELNIVPSQRALEPKINALKRALVEAGVQLGAVCLLHMLFFVSIFHMF